MNSSSICCLLKKPIKEEQFSTCGNKYYRRNEMNAYGSPVYIRDRKVFPLRNWQRTDFFRSCLKVLENQTTNSALMDISTAKWSSELEYMDDLTFSNQYQMNLLDYSFDEFNFQSISPESYSSYSYPNAISPENLQNPSGNNNSCIEPPQTFPERPTKQLKTKDQQHIATNTPSFSSSQIISFKDWVSSPANSQQLYGLERGVKPKKEMGTEDFPCLINGGNNQFGSQSYGQGIKRIGSVNKSSTPLHAQDHVIAERKRRENINQRFIALSALLPGLKKTDKASILADAAKYLNHLQERVKTLEEQATKKKMESAIFVKKSHVSLDDESSSSDETSESTSDQPLPEIEARVANKDVLIRIHCEQSKGCIVKILSEIEKLHLNVLNSSVLPFGNCTLDVTIVAQMDAGFSMTLKDLVRNLRLALLKFM